MEPPWGGAVRQLAGLINRGDHDSYRKAAAIGRDINRGKILGANRGPASCLGQIARVRDPGQSVRILDRNERLIEGRLVSVDAEQGFIELQELEDSESTPVRLSASDITQIQYQQGHYPNPGWMLLGAVLGATAGALIGDKIIREDKSAYLALRALAGLAVGSGVGLVTAGIVSSLPTTETYPCAQDRGPALGPGDASAPRPGQESRRTLGP